uniref:Uncharacterized protein n=1 Tax=Brassica oleracea var. oleracea TaxID=109376 RepID=A0A0D3CH02_BRAOL
MGSSFDTREAVREYLRSITGLDDESQLKRVRAERKGYSMHDKRVVDMFSMSRPGVSRIPIPRIVKANGVQANHSRFIWQRDKTWVLRPRARGLCYGNLDEDARFRDRKSVLTHGRGDLGAGRPPPWARIDRELVFREFSGIDSAVNGFDPNRDCSKEEFEVEQEEKEAYWDALCGSITPTPEVFYPTRPATQLDLTLPSRTSPAYLKTLREFLRVPSGVVFRVPVHGESAEDPPEGFFTCYEAFLTRCRTRPF